MIGEILMCKSLEDERLSALFYWMPLDFGVVGRLYNTIERAELGDRVG